MKRILSDYYKHYCSMIISNCCLVIFVPLFFIFMGYSLNSASGVIITLLYALAEALGLWSLADKFIAVPLALKKQLAEMPAEESAEIISEYPDAKIVDKHRYMNEHFVFFFADKIYLLRYSDIRSASLVDFKLKLTINGYKKAVTMPFKDYGTNAAALAFLRSKNPRITIMSPERTNTK